MNSTFTQQDKSLSAGDLNIEAESPPSYVTFRKNMGSNKNSLSLKDFEEFQVKIVDIMDEKFAAMLALQESKMSTLLGEFGDVKKSVQFMSEKFDEFNKKLDNLDSRVLKIEGGQQQFDLKMVQLEDKIEIMEMQARQTNVEIGNVPEKKGENLVALLLNIGAIIKFPVNAHDILAVHRIPHADPKNAYPKNIIVKFSSRILRDNFLAANRAAKGLTTDQLEMGGTKRRIFINEHLTLKKKMLFREARIAAQKHRFKYVWPKNGNIFVRHSEGAPAFILHSVDDITKKITGTSE